VIGITGISSDPVERDLHSSIVHRIVNLRLTGVDGPLKDVEGAVRDRGTGKGALRVIILKRMQK
jgi:hypothetical protein